LERGGCFLAYQYPDLFKKVATHAGTLPKKYKIGKLKHSKFPDLAMFLGEYDPVITTIGIMKMQKLSMKQYGNISQTK